MLAAASVAFVLSYFLLVWLRTNAFVEYMALVRLDRFFHISDYFRVKQDGYGGTYTDFLSEYFNEFFIVRLLVCPVCLSFWLGVIASLVSGSITNICIAPLVLFFYLLFNKLL